MKKNKNGFSLTELLVAISIITILALGAGNMNFKPQIDSENALLFSNDIYTNIESIRNNSLLGKGVLSGSSLIYPKKWNINVKTAGNGSIKGSYSTGGALTNYDTFKVNFINSASKIQELKCWNINKSPGSSSTGSTIDIELVGGSITFSGCTSPNDAILDIKTQYHNFYKTIRINKVSGLMEKF